MRRPRIYRMERELALLKDMNKRIARATFGKLIPVERPNHCAVGHENNFNQVLEAARDCFDARTIGPATNQRACSAARASHRGHVNRNRPDGPS